MALMLSDTIRLDLSQLTWPEGVPLQNHPLILATNAHVHVQQRNEIHYDTPDLALRRNNLALTLFRKGEQWLQCCSTRDSHEQTLKWMEMPVAANQLDLMALKTSKKLFPSHILSRLQSNSVDILAPVFTLHCHDQQWSLELPDNVKMIIREERGYLKFGATRQLFHELVFERQSGSLARWFQTVLSVAYHLAPNEKTELGLACTTPVARGFAWLEPSLIMPSMQACGQRESREVADKAVYAYLPFDLQNKMTTRQAFSHICSQLLQRIHACRGVILYGSKQTKLDGIQWLYQTTTQLHTLTLLCHELLPEEIRGEMDKELCWLLKELDVVREWQVFLNNTLEPLIEQFNAYSGLEAPLAKARDGQQLAVKRMGKLLASFRYTRLLVGMANWVESNSWECLSDPNQREGMATPVTVFAKEMLQRYHSQLRKRGHTFTNMDIPARNNLRDNIDFLTHTAHLFAELFNNKHTPVFLLSLGRLQNNSHTLVDLQASNRFFNRLVDQKEKTIGHLIRGWQGARTKRRILDSTQAWEQYTSESTFW